MKKNIFIILTTILFILVLLYFYEQREKVLNKEYLDSKHHIYIEYPYFHRIKIDEYLNKYFNSYIERKKWIDSFLFIDYDYFELKNDEGLLTMYIYEKLDGIVRELQKDFFIDIGNEKIWEQDALKEVDIDYDSYHQKFIDTNKPMIALTFDDGPNHNTSKILDILEHYGVKATFFILGTNINGNEKIIKRMSNLGMEIGNHMYSHKLLTKLKNEEIIEEIKRVDQLVFNITGKYPTLIRPSYGIYNKKILSIIDRPVAIWNVDTLDWKYHNSKKIYQRVMNKEQDGNIILMHDIYHATANSLYLIIPKLQEMGYQLVTVSDLFYYKGISMKNGLVYHQANKKIKVK